MINVHASYDFCRKGLKLGGKGGVRSGSPGVVAFHGSNNVDLGDTLNMQEASGQGYAMVRFLILYAA